MKRIASEPSIQGQGQRRFIINWACGVLKLFAAHKPLFESLAWRQFPGDDRRRATHGSKRHVSEIPPDLTRIGRLCRLQYVGDRKGDGRLLDADGHRF